MGQQADIIDRYQRAISETEQILLYPFVMESQEGARMVGVDGDNPIDLFASWAVGSTGYRHPTILNRIEQQLEKGYTNSPITIPHEPLVELAERLLERFPGEFDTKVWFGHSGSEAGDLISRSVPDIASGDAIVSFEGGYHGATKGSAAISGHTAQEGVGSESDVTLPFPYPYRASDPNEERDAILNELAATFDRHDVGAVITEPIQSDGGIRVPPAGFISSVASMCHDNDAYFIVDEVKAGLGRTGSFWAFDHYDIVPDAVMLGKPLGSGVPISAVIGRQELVDYEPATHMMTTAGSPLAAAAGVGTLDVIESEDLPERATSLGKQFRSYLADESSSIDTVGDIRGRGLMCGIELVETDSDMPNLDLTAQTVFRARELGVLVAYVGMESNVLEITPPLTIEKEELLEAADRLVEAIKTAREVDTGRLEKYAGW